MARVFVTDRPLTRRRLLRLGLGAAAGLLAAGLGAGPAGAQPDVDGRLGPTRAAASSLLLARPGRPGAAGAAPGAPTGVQALGRPGERETLLYVPSGYEALRPAPLVVSLHGAGGNANHGLALLQEFAESAGFLLLATSSRGRTWDVVLGGYGPDVTATDRALGETFARYEVDPARLALAGFSDGASYALSLGLANGDLFSHLIAFSPGFMAPAGQQGRPRIFVSHGTEDPVLPVDGTSREIVPRLERAGYDVRYLEFSGGHTVPQEVRREAVGWFLPG